MAMTAMRPAAALAAFIVCLSFISSSIAQAKSFNEREDVRNFISNLSSKHNFDRKQLETLFQQIELKQEIIDAMTRPYESKSWYEYRPIFVTDSRTQGGIRFMNEHRGALQKAEAQYGVPAEVITAIIGVESLYGEHKGKFRVVDSLSTLGFEYPPRAAFFKKELEQFLLLSREEGFSPLEISGSYAGAMGKPQFISSSYREYAVDFDKDGTRDLLNNSDDAIGSVANFLARHGWVRDQTIAVPAHNSGNANGTKSLKPKTTISDWKSRGVTPKLDIAPSVKAALIELKTESGAEHWLGTKNFYAITRYNHSPLYAMAVYQLSQAIKAGDAKQQAQR